MNRTGYLLCLLAFSSVLGCGNRSSGNFVTKPISTESKLESVGGVDGALRRLSEGMTTNQVDELLGKPDSTRSKSEEQTMKGNFTWSYYEWLDLKAGKMKFVIVKFREFRVQSITTGS